MLDLMKIAITESEGGDLQTCIGQLYQNTDVRPNSYPNALVFFRLPRNLVKSRHSVTLVFIEIFKAFY